VPDRPTPADRLRAKQPRTIEVGVWLDETPADRLDAATIARVEARRQHADVDELTALDKLVDESRAELDAATMWFRLRALGRSAFARLLAEHPPTETEVARAQAAGRPGPQFASSLAPALIHACMVEPDLSRADIDALYEDESGWNEQELGALFAAALGVNTQARPLRVRADE
jgi:hypothetical protein